MISDELLNKFDRIEDLPVSEEMLGAYIEGKLDVYDMDNVSKLIHNDSLLQSIVEEISIDVLDFPTNSESINIESYDSDHSYEYQYSDISDVELSEFYDRADDIIELEIEHTYNDSDIDSLVDDPSFELPDIPFL